MGLPARSSIPSQHFGVFFNWTRFIFMLYAVLYHSGLHFMGRKGHGIYFLTWCFGCECTGRCNAVCFFAILASPGSQFGFILVWMLPMGRVWFLPITILAHAQGLAGSPLTLLCLNALLSPKFKAQTSTFCPTEITDFGPHVSRAI